MLLGPFGERFSLQHLFWMLFGPRIYWAKTPFLQKMSIIHRMEGCTNGLGLILSGSRSELYRLRQEVKQEKRCTACTKVKSKVL